MWTVETLKEWHDFYVLIGTAGATLLALLFVAVSIGAGYLTEEHQAATRTFMSPVVVHFTSVFFLSAVALFPWHQAKIFAALIGATALFGAIISTYITIQGLWADCASRGSLAPGDRQHPQRLGSHPHYGPPASPSGLADRRGRDARFR